MRKCLFFYGRFREVATEKNNSREIKFEKRDIPEHSLTPTLYNLNKLLTNVKKTMVCEEWTATRLK